MDPHAPELRQAAGWLRSAREVVVFSGAGASAESGIATFRDEGGLWDEFPPDEFANWPSLLRMAALRPKEVARFVLAVLEPIARAVPNDGHRAAADLERHTGVKVVTQNVDGLHSEAGSTVVHQVHGSLFEIVTLSGRFVRLIGKRQMQKIVESLRCSARSRLSAARLMTAIRPMLGMGIRGPYRPSVVMFGQALAEPDWQLACEAAEACDCMITVGTSEAVMPAAGLPQMAASGGARIIRIDPEPGYADVWLPGPSATVLPALVQAAFGE